MTIVSCFVTSIIIKIIMYVKSCMANALPQTTTLPTMYKEKIIKMIRLTFDGRLEVGLLRRLGEDT